MLLTEFESKRLLKAVGISVPAGFLIRDAARLGRRRVAYPVAVKAQVSAGGRGKVGGIVRAEDPEALATATIGLLSREIQGEVCDAVLIEPWLAIERELYLSVTVDGGADGYVVLYRPEGGIEVESGAPPLRYEVGPPAHFRAHRLRQLLAPVEPDARLAESVVRLARQLLGLAVARDCLTVEINPLALLGDGSLLAVDAKVVRDDAAAFRDAGIRAALERERRRQPRAIARALQGRLMLVWLEGEVGLISGGAGMTMAAMDAIADAGGRPACFLDSSANPTPEGYRLAFDLLDSTAEVGAILVSIFGGATQMDRVARSITKVMATRRASKPVFFRLNGTGAERIPEIFAAAALHNHDSLEAAAGEAVAAAAIGVGP